MASSQVQSDEISDGWSDQKQGVTFEDATKDKR